jgi:membrane-associated phospholipid phosphatase
MLKLKILQSILLSGCLSFFVPDANAQNAEVRLLRKINPTNPSSKFWKATTNSVAPIAISLPVATFATGFITKNSGLYEDGFEAIGTLAINSAATLALKHGVNRPRPSQRYADIYPDHFEDGLSFPSGHTSMAFATATTLSINHKRWYFVVPAYTWASAVAYSRLYLGQHHPTDLIGGAITGAGSAWLSHKANSWLRKKKRQ